MESKKSPSKSNKFILIAIVALGFISGVISITNTSHSTPPVPDPIVQEQKIILPEKSTTGTSSNFADVKTHTNTQLSNDNYYTNVNGSRVHAPAYADTVPTGATAQCGDGTYSFSQNHRGTCSHHGGVSEWLD